MIRLSLTLLAMAAAYAIYLFAPIPGLSQIDHKQLQIINQWAPGSMQINHGSEVNDSTVELWLTGSSVAATLFPNSDIEVVFAGTPTRVYHTSFATFRDMNNLFGKDGVMPPPKRHRIFCGTRSLD